VEGFAMTDYKKDLTIKGVTDTLDFGHALALAGQLGSSYTRLAGGSDAVVLNWAGNKTSVSKAEIPDILVDLTSSLVEHSKSNDLSSRDSEGAQKLSAATSMVWNDYIQNRRRW
jgi:hypothetical protein